MTAKIHGIRKALQDIRSTPRGFMVQVFIDRNTGFMWTSEYLTCNQWTIARDPADVLLGRWGSEDRDIDMKGLRMRAEIALSEA